VARGWESKGVEAQQEEARRGAERARADLSPEAADREARRRTLELALARARADEARATTAAYRSMLAAAIETLTAQLDAIRENPR
jgi:hypothetical protein